MAANNTNEHNYCLRWHNYPSNLMTTFNQLLQSECFADVTLVCDGRSLKAHKIILSTCSPYFRNLFLDNPCRHPVVIMHDIEWAELNAAVTFMYRGEVSVPMAQIRPLLRVAELLQIHGLSDLDDQPSPKARKHHHNGNAPELLTIEQQSTGMEVASLGKMQQQSIGIEVASLVKIPPRRVKKQSICTEAAAPSGQSVEDMDFEAGSNIDSPTTLNNNNKVKVTWSKNQLQSAIRSVVMQRMRFTQAAVAYNIPKGTLYDNILGKVGRMDVLDEAGLTPTEERDVLDYCCDVAAMPHNRRTRRPLTDVLSFVERMRRRRDPCFTFTGLAGFRWWWAFCKKHAVVSLYYEDGGGGGVELDEDDDTLLS